MNLAGRLRSWLAASLRPPADQAAEARRDEDEWRRFFEQAPMPMHSMGADGQLIAVNEAWLALMGYTREEAIGRRVEEFMTDASRALREELLPDIQRRGGIFGQHFQVLRKTGEVLDIILHARVERDRHGRFRRSLSVVTDVTAQRRAEAALRREKEFSQLLIDSTTEGILAVDREYRYTLFNPSMEQITGVKREAAIGRVMFDVFPFLRGSPAETAWRQAVEQQQASSVEEVRYASPAGKREGFYEGYYAPLLGSDGACIGAVGLIRETTERQRMEETLRQSQKMEAVGQLTGGVAHDFNNLLTTILGSLDLAAARVADEEVRKLLAGAIRSAERGARLNQQLLAFSRKQHLEPRALDLVALVQTMDEMLPRTIGPQVQIEMAADQGLWPGFADANQIELAILNLAVNARDAMPEGGTLTIALSNVAADTPGRPPDLPAGDFVAIAVSDTGHGMDEATQRKAFEPFFTTKEVGRGSGLGLSQVYGMATQSGGTATLESEPGRGTTVRLFLPRAAAAIQPKPSQAASPGAAVAASAVVLVVDDDDDVRETTAASLRALGYRVVEAGGGREALEIAPASYDLLLADYAMPEMNGNELARRLRQSRPELPIVLMTGHADVAAAARDIDRAILLRKPFRHAELGPTVRTAFTRMAKARYASISGKEAARRR